MGEPAYEAVSPHPGGESTVSRLALVAREYGYGGIAVRERTGDGRTTYDPAAVRERFGIDVVRGIEVRAESPASASGAIGNYRSSHTLVIVRGSRTLNRFAAERPRVDVLSRPMADGDVNHVTVKAAAHNGVRLEFDFGPVLRTEGGRRVRALSALRKLRELVREYDAPYVVSAAPASHLELRAPRELAALGDVVGFTRSEIEAGLAEWGRLAARNRDRRSEAFIEPGVREGKYDEDA